MLYYQTAKGAEPMDPNKLITPDEAAEILGITGNRVRQKTRKGRLPAQKVTDCWLVIHTG